MGWLAAALRDIQHLKTLPPPPVPTCIFMGTEERVVDCHAMMRLVADWPNAVLHKVSGARHEILMETPQIRQRVLGDIMDFFDQVAATENS